MAQKWDDPSLEVEEDDPNPEEVHSFQVWAEGWLRLCFEKLSPGGVIKVFGATRTFHRMTAAMESVGFEDLRVEAWAYGSGFPKSLDVSKAIGLRAGGAVREVVGTRTLSGNAAQTTKEKGGTYASNTNSRGVPPKEIPITAPATEAARQWEGWGTALKPAWEPFIVGKKPAP
jgi:site-specific DNA-methyltransferase (adenine-specific)